MPAISRKKSGVAPAADLAAAKRAFLERKDQRVRRAFVRAPRDGLKQDIQLAEQLRRCSPDSPCRLAFCPSCVRGLQSVHSDAVLSCVNAIWPGPGALAEIPITKFLAAPFSDSHTVRIRQLFSLDLVVTLEKMAHALRRLNSAVTFLGAHLRLDEDGHGKRESSWQITLHGVVVGATPADVRRILEPICPSDILSSSNHPKVIKITGCSDMISGVKNCIKPHVRRHVVYLSQSGRRITRRHGLRRDELLEVTRLLRRCDLENRYMLIGGRWFNFVTAPADRYPFTDE